MSDNFTKALNELEQRAHVKTKRVVKPEEIALLEHSIECQDCGHAVSLHTYAGGMDMCEIEDCDCMI